MFAIILGIGLGMGFLGYLEILNFWRNCQNFTFPPAGDEGFNFSTSSPTGIIVSLVNTKRCAVRAVVVLTYPSLKISDA